MANPNNVLGGHKATINNPNTSEEAKQHSKEVLENESGGGNTDSTKSGSTDSTKSDGKNPGNVAGGLKSTLSNPNTSEEAKQSAQERLENM